MKKILFLLSVIILMSVSCEGPMGPMGPMGERGEKGEKGEAGSEWYIREYTVRSDQWVLVGGGVDDLNSYYQYEVSMPELDEDIFYDGKMTGYMYLDKDYRIQAELPEVIHLGEYNPSTGSDYLWTETYKCDYAVGSVMFKVEYSDFYTGNRPGTKRFRVVLNY
ncbi:MAG: hypothetical protein LBH77_02190 [Tannerella sp.]|jgi:hypothetical protein|nr:hypothetical protein [Tannerella sp.]